MRDWTKRTAMVLASGGLLALASPTLSAQEREAGEAEADEERCVCVGAPDAHRIRANADRIRRRIMRRLDDRGHLGIVLRESYGEDGPAEGVRVAEVVDDGPAEEAGLREGDVILALGGHPLDEALADPEEEDDLDDERHLPSQRLVALLGDHEPGDRVEVTVRRDGEERTTAVDLGEPPVRRAFRGGRAPRIRALREMRRPGPPGPPRGLGHGGGGPDRPEVFEHRGGPPGAPGAPRVHAMMRGAMEGFRWMEECGELAGPGVMARRSCVAGLEVRSLNEGLSEYFGADRGALVLDVSEGSSLGLEPGDVVLSVTGREVQDREDLRRILRSYEEGEPVELGIRRQGRERTVEGMVP